MRRAIADVPIRYAGYTAWRGVSSVPVEAGRLTESWGVGERFGLVDIGRGRTYWFATKNAPEGEPDEPGGRKAEILRRFSGWHEPIAAVVEAADESAILRNDVYYLEPLPRWSDGRVVLVGDAAHATTPGVGQGAAQAIEDAVVLAERLAESDELAAALAEYEAIRRPRADAVLKMSRRADKAAQLANPLGWRLRNAIVISLAERAQHRQSSRSSATSSDRRPGVRPASPSGRGRASRCGECARGRGRRGPEDAAVTACASPVNIRATSTIRTVRPSVSRRPTGLRVGPPTTCAPTRRRRASQNEWTAPRRRPSTRTRVASTYGSMTTTQV